MNLSPELLVRAYARGLFPMADPYGTIQWYDPDPRAILPLDAFHRPRRLVRLLRQGRFRVTTDRAFETVMRACAERPEGSWINEELVATYGALAAHGLAHSIEVWEGEALVGGLYGVALNGLFAAESMFSRVSNASKVALSHLVERLNAGGYRLLDVQFVNSHLVQFGVREIPRRAYHARLAGALAAPARWEALDDGIGVSPRRAGA